MAPSADIPSGLPRASSKVNSPSVIISWPEFFALALVVTDGRSTERAAVAHAAARLAQAAHGVVVFDGEQGPVRLNLAGDLAVAANAQLLSLEALAA